VIRKEQSSTSRSSEEVVERTFYVLDSYALFAYFQDEEGADIVADLIERTAEDVSLRSITFNTSGPTIQVEV
jgi:hypothetical protein